MKRGLGPLRLQMGQTVYVNCGGPRVLSRTPGLAPGFTSTSTHGDENIGCTRGVFFHALFGGHGPDGGLHIPGLIGAHHHHHHFSTSPKACSESAFSSHLHLLPLPSPSRLLQILGLTNTSPTRRLFISPLPWRACEQFVSKFRYRTPSKRGPEPKSVLG